MRPSLVAAALLFTASMAGCADAEPELPGFVQRPDSRLIKVQSVGLAAFGPINPHTATVSQVREAFGEPSSEIAGGAQCRRRWGSLGLEIRFEGGEGGSACTDGGRITWLAVTGERAASEDWRTAEGIRPLQSEQAVERIYPHVGEISPGVVVLVRPPEGLPGPRVLEVRMMGGKVRRMMFPVKAG
jgi:hypothetical protein